MYPFIKRLAHLMALVGGVILTFLILLTCVSILGRGINTFAHSDMIANGFSGLSQWLLATGVGPVNGDFELVEAGIAMAIFAFLPICQLYSSHATVDIFTNQASEKTNAWLMAFWEIVMTAVIILITARHYEGTMSLVKNGQTTFLLQFPVWWAYAASLVAAIGACIVAIYCAVARVIFALTGKNLMPASLEADH